MVLLAPRAAERERGGPGLGFDTLLEPKNPLLTPERDNYDKILAYGDMCAAERTDWRTTRQSLLT